MTSSRLRKLGSEYPPLPIDKLPKNEWWLGGYEKLITSCFLQSDGDLQHRAIPWTSDRTNGFWVYQSSESPFRSTD